MKIRYQSNIDSMEHLSTSLPNGFDAVEQCIIEHNNTNETLNVLLKYGQSPFTLGAIMGQSALHLACQLGHMKKVRTLVQKGAFINLPDPLNGFTPLMNAVWHRHIKVIIYLLSLPNINIYTKSVFGTTAEDIINELKTEGVSESVAKIHVQEAEKTQELFNAYKVKLNAQLRSQTIMATLITAQTEQEKYKIIERALHNGEDVNATYPVTSNGNDAHTPLLVAARDGYANIAQLLLEHGADITIKCGYMLANPAHKAAYYGHPNVIEVLAIHPKFKLIRDEQGPYNGYTPLMDAVWHGHTEATRKLIQFGANKSLKNYEGMTAHTMAKELGYTDIITLLR